MKYLSAVMVAALVAVVASVGIYAVTPDSAEAASEQARKCGGGTISLNGREFKSFKQHNNIRRSNGLSVLCVHPALQKAARKHSRDMIARQYFSHTSKGSGRGADDRIEAEGYRWRTYGENIGCHQSPGQTMNAWMNSSGHRTNILNRNFKEVGIGVASGEISGFCSGKGTAAYTVNFGAR